MYLILLLCKRLNISSKMVPEILAKKQRISFCCGPCANTQSLLQNGGIAMREILVPSLFCFGFLVVALTRVNNANHQIILGPSVTHQKCYYSPHGCYSKNCSVIFHSKNSLPYRNIQTHSFLFILFHCSLTIVHTSAISWGIAVALPMQKIPKHCGKIHPIQTHSEKKQAHSTQFKNVQTNQKTTPFEKHGNIQTKKQSVLWPSSAKSIQWTSVTFTNKQTSNTAKKGIWDSQHMSNVWFSSLKHHSQPFFMFSQSCPGSKIDGFWIWNVSIKAHECPSQWQLRSSCNEDQLRYDSLCAVPRTEIPEPLARSPLYRRCLVQGTRNCALSLAHGLALWQGPIARADVVQR